jgi:hypothetical protein
MAQKQLSRDRASDLLRQLRDLENVPQTSALIAATQD